MNLLKISVLRFRYRTIFLTLQAMKKSLVSLLARMRKKQKYICKACRVGKVKGIGKGIFGKSKKSLEMFGEKAEFLINLTDYLIDRKF